MGDRLKLDEILRVILGSTNVYYQPPETLKMEYPCIVYNPVSVQTTFADDRPYKFKRRYSVTYIDKRPDSLTLYKLLELPFCVHDRHYVKNNLNHDAFNLYF